MKVTHCIPTPNVLLSVLLFARYFLHGSSDGSIHSSSDLEEENDESKTQNSISEQQPSIQTSANVKVNHSHLFSCLWSNPFGKLGIDKLHWF